MNIFFISYGDLEYDGRLRSLINVMEQIGEVYSFTRGGKATEKHSVYEGKYIKFINASVKKGKELSKRLGTIDILFLDNRKATIPGLLLRQSIKPKYIIQDCRELYLLNETHHFSGKIGCLFEKMMAKKADVVICANQERAQIMQQEYVLINEPLTYENLRQLQYDSKEKKEKAAEKFAEYFKDDEIRIISSSGCSISRTNDVLVKSLKNVNQKCRLFLVGNSDPREEDVVRKLAAEDKVNEVTILGQLNQTELKFLISQCHIGIVNYGQYDTNNKYCASGKLYEFIYEGIPVVTTTNPPLKRICDSESIGIADDNYSEGINTIITDYNKYKKSVKDFSCRFTVINNDDMIIGKIKSIILKSGINTSKEG